MLIRLFLALSAVAIGLMISGYLLTLLEQSTIAEMLTSIGMIALFVACLSLTGYALIAVIKQLLYGLSEFFSAPSRRRRLVLFALNQQDRRRDLVNFKRAQIDYFYRLKKQRLLAANNRRHINELAKQIKKDLHRIKPNLSQDEWKTLRQQLKSFRQRQDSDGLVNLHYQITEKIGKP